MHMRDHWLPAWVEDRSWWVKWSFAAGLGLLSAFLPTILGLSWQKLGAGVGTFLVLLSLVGGTWEGVNEWRAKHKKEPIVFEPVYRVALCGLGLVYLICFLIAPKQSAIKLTDTPDLVSMFVSDLEPRLGFTVYGCTEYDQPDFKGIIYYKVLGEVPFNSKILSFYIPSSNYTFHLIESLATDYNDWIIQVENTIHFNNNIQGNSTSILSQHMMFSNVIYVYTEDNLDAVQIGNLTNSFNAKGLVLELRSINYLMGAWDAIKAGRIGKIPQYRMAGCRIVPVKS
jgi:hypothetical protein